jgi:hypothetical protein
MKLRSCPGDDYSGIQNVGYACHRDEVPKGISDPWPDHIDIHIAGPRGGEILQFCRL